VEKKLKKEIILFFLLVFISGILFFLDKKRITKRVRGILGKPILKAEQKIYGLKIGIEESVVPIFRSRQIEKELLRLQFETQRLAVGQNELSNCLEENEKMRKLLGAPLPAKWKFLPAKVMGSEDLMRIDKGEKDEVEPGMIVVSENILVGRVASVGENSSLIQLPVSWGVKMPAVVKRKQGVQARGLLVGQPGGKLVLDRVLQSEDIQKGDLVVTAGSEDWPPDLLIGQISEVLPKSAQVYQKAQVRPLVEYDKLRIVFIVISN